LCVELLHLSDLFNGNHEIGRWVDSPCGIFSKIDIKKYIFGQRPLVPLLLLCPPFFPIILFVSTTLLTGMTGNSLHIQCPKNTFFMEDVTRKYCVQLYTTGSWSVSNSTLPIDHIFTLAQNTLFCVLHNKNIGSNYNYDNFISKNNL
jgi:hypothetical protein